MLFLQQDHIHIKILLIYHFTIHVCSSLHHRHFTLKYENHKRRCQPFRWRANIVFGKQNTRTFYAIHMFWKFDTIYFIILSFSIRSGSHTHTHTHTLMKYPVCLSHVFVLFFPKTIINSSENSMIPEDETIVSLP